MEAEPSELERELCRIPEIDAARVVVGDGGEPVEVHILASPSKHAKQLVRDIQSVAQASFGVDLDRRIISIVQLGRPDGSPEPDDEHDHHHDLVVDGDEDAPGRITVDSVTAVRTGVQCTAQVILRRGDEEATGVADGITASSTSIRLVAAATVAALRQLEPAAGRCDVEHAALVPMAGRTVAVVTVVVLVPPYEEVVSGAAMVRNAGDLDAVARAVLAATNRRLPQLR